MPAPQVILEPMEPPDCRVCPVSAVLPDFPDSRETE